MVTEKEIKSLVDRQWADRRSSIDEIMSMVAITQIKTNEKINILIDTLSKGLNVDPVIDASIDYRTNKKEISIGVIGVTLNTADSDNIISCVFDGIILNCWTKGRVTQYERVVIVPGGNESEPYVVALSVLMKGDAGIAVHQDETGSMISLMQGIYNDTLTTVAVDADGRMLTDAILSGLSKASVVIVGKKIDINTIATKIIAASTTINNAIIVKCRNLGTGSYIALGNATDQELRFTAVGDWHEIDYIDDLSKIYVITDAGNTGELEWIGG